MKKIMKKLKRVNGQSLAEFAVTTAMMATLATTAAPKFSGVGEGAKEKKTLYYFLETHLLRDRVILPGLINLVASLKSFKS